MMGKLQTETKDSWGEELLGFIIILTSLFPILIGLLCGLNITIKIEERTKP